MLHATEIIGAETYDSLGNYVGRVKEMFVEPADQPNRVAHLLLSRGQYRAASRPLRSDRLRSPRPHHPHHRRIRAGSLSPQRSLASRRQRPPRSTNNRHEWPQSSPRQRH